MYTVSKQLTLHAAIKVRKTAKIRKRYYQVPHLTQDTTRESNKKYNKNITNKSHEVSLFPEDDHKAAMNGRESMLIVTPDVGFCGCSMFFVRYFMSILVLQSS